MAEGTKLVLTFTGNDGGTKTLTFSYAKPRAGLANVKALGNGIVANGEIFESYPVAFIGAKEVTTSENIYDIDTASSMREVVEMTSGVPLTGVANRTYPIR